MNDIIYWRKFRTVRMIVPFNRVFGFQITYDRCHTIPHLYATSNSLWSLMFVLCYREFLVSY